MTGVADSLGAILLAGGRASRVDGAAKPLFEVGGTTLLARAVMAATDAGAAPITVVGPTPDAQRASFVSADPGVPAVPGDSDAPGNGGVPSGLSVPGLPGVSADDRLDWVREDPPFGGPAAATVAALEAWAARGTNPEWMLLLACDLPRADAVVARLRADILLLPSDTDGLCLADASGRPQWLSGLYRTSSVAAAASALPDHGRNAPARALFHDMKIAVVRAESGIVDDIDTWDDLARARARAAEEES